MQTIVLDYARSQLRSELTWTKAKLALVCHMAAGLRAKLQQAQAERAQAGEMAGCHGGLLAVSMLYWNGWPGLHKLSAGDVVAAAHR